MNKPVITKECVKPAYESKYVKVFDLNYAEGKHYMDATRRTKEDLVATKSDEEFKSMLPDAASCFVIVKTPDEEPRLLLNYEFRYPTGQYLLSVPAGLIDPEDKNAADPLIVTAKREIFEETGITVKDTDEIYVVNPCAFSTPGMTDESNGLVAAIIELPDLSCLSQEGAVGSEAFSGFELLTKEHAKEILKSGRDDYGNYYSIFTWAALSFFLSQE